jgi:hypothetical protein
MEELEDIPGARIFICERFERRDVGMAPCRGVVCGMDKGGEVCRRDFVWRYEEGEDLDAEIGESFVRPGLLPIGGELWDGGWDVEPAIRGETGEHCLRGVSARALVSWI